MTRLSHAIKVGSVIFGLTAPVTVGFAQESTITAGQLSVLTGDWWQWALSIPVSENPLVDQTGSDCNVGQRGRVWFLAGNLTGQPAVTRKCSLPEDKSLFFPIIN